MGDGFVFIEIVIFAMIAAFLVYRLRSVLGRRTGEERQRSNPFTSAPGAAKPDNVVTLPERNRPRPDVAPGADLPASDEPLSLAASIDQIRAADPNFDEKHFLEGAKAAFSMIVDAFARGDTATLRPLLADDVYDSFARVIRDRQAAGEQHETRIEQVREAEVVEAKLDAGRTARITVRLVSDQVNVVRDRNGTIVDGDPKALVENTDVWTFARNLRSRDPNWALVEVRPVQ
ncbi:MULTISPECIES: Tim44/TimA family putative adaptor protein [Azospirillum]|uniref:Tim44 domain-containing protein n=1 Tax=Azospirillum lipoferum TaxID=193 RepID=A0A5A9GVN9_AZOLI|nr:MULTISPECIES: Tim44/TimA family putative adaptor protein [Azospirillum]KAA0597614.1 Tim44 domain-containing protein [Azospirillum lipoferum]MDW5534241.1 Tim44/TimA family putative adaptor protein [Azospirillum sp. NL1]